jgi:hypothetical protein
MSEAAVVRQTGGKHSEETKQKRRLTITRTLAIKSGIDVTDIPDNVLIQFVADARETLRQKERTVNRLTPAQRREVDRARGETLKTTWTPERRKEHAARCSLRRHTPESKAKIAAANTKRKGVFKHSPEARQKMSEHSAWRLKKGNFHYLGRVETVKGGLCGFRSWWERRAIDVLETDPTISSFSYESLVVPYTWSGQPRRTVPDFLVTLVTGSILVAEVKPSGYVKNPKEQAKAEAVRAFCATRGWLYETWTEARLWPGLSRKEVQDAVKRMRS